VIPDKNKSGVKAAFYFKLKAGYKQKVR
jgi:hypothetical protein